LTTAQIPVPTDSANLSGGRPQAGARKREITLSFWLMVGPLVLGLLLFTFLPIVWGFALSLTDARGTISLNRFVGLANYTQILSDPAFIRSLVTVTIFAIFIVPTTYAASLLLAVLVQNAAFGKGFFRSVFFIPTAISYVIASLIWRVSIFNGLPYGFANVILWIFGVDPIAWIGTPHPPWYWLVLVTVRLWLQVGFYMILFIAAMQDIPRELYEAARVDGASSKWTLFRRITFPLLRNTSVFVILMNIIHAFNAFDEFYNILGGTYASSGNIILARPPLVYLYQVAMSDLLYGRAMAGSFILAILLIAATVLGNKVVGGLGREV
jgi:multiple sugar transport system permease protein